ncbi:DUF4082 domain-containing protein [Nocardioides sp. T2.26MG-1]|uniref:DUF4082 domain-containing protein n=1 Tax=Nocardioides sp. T2.26MG-1 TaxID=3041166 RepID=UPI0024773787|nr:DUF4082 domain-containing protein [Nocardioides sp. T2.26MG-1]CAI9398624.1 hypothetical protein HIDPHFAB_00033 [Nocardioides sp. T2.26MG-1]
MTTHAHRRRRDHGGRPRAALTAVLLSIGLTLPTVTFMALVAPASVAQAGGLFPADGTVEATQDSDVVAVELGMRFIPKVAGQATGVRVFKISASPHATPDSGTVWDSRGRRLATTTFETTPTTGWLAVDFDEPVDLRPGETYTVSVHVPHGRYAVTERYFDHRIETSQLVAPGSRNGVYRYGTSSQFPFQTYHSSNYWVDVAFVAVDAAGTPTSNPTSSTGPDGTPSSSGETQAPPAPPSGGAGTSDNSPTGADPTDSTPTDSTPTDSTPTDSTPTDSTPTDSTPTDSTPTSPPPTDPSGSPTNPTPPTGDWPGPDNTGMPSGTALTAYSGPCTITRPTRLTAVDATSCDAILVRSAGVVISDSLLPRVDVTDGRDDSVTVTDSTVRGGDWVDGAVWGSNITLTRVEVTGGQHSVHCGDQCTVTDSWLHEQYNPAGRSFHNNAFISNGGNTMVVRHNTLACTPQVNSSDGGCTADLSLFGDFEPIRDVRIERNLFVANPTGISYCLHAGHNPGKPYGTDPRGVQVVDNVFQRGNNGRCGVWGAVTSFLEDGTGNVWSGNVWDDGTALRP